jgi:hypothetical protein
MAQERLCLNGGGGGIERNHCTDSMHGLASGGYRRYCYLDSNSYAYRSVQNAKYIDCCLGVRLGERQDMII